MVWSRTPVERHRRQVSWLAGRRIAPSPSRFPSGAPLPETDTALAAYSCGHSRGFAPRSLLAPGEGDRLGAFMLHCGGVGKGCGVAGLVALGRDVRIFAAPGRGHPSYLITAHAREGGRPHCEPSKRDCGRLPPQWAPAFARAYGGGGRNPVRGGRISVQVTPRRCRGRRRACRGLRRRRGGSVRP